MIKGSFEVYTSAIRIFGSPQHWMSLDVTTTEVTAMGFTAACVSVRDITDMNVTAKAKDATAMDV